VRLSAVLLVLASAGMLLGGALIARWALGVCVIADSLAVGVFALRWDDGTAQPVVHEVQGTVASVLERARRAA
jgi:hypothetical protein